MRSDLPALLGGAPAFPDGPPAWPFPDPDVHAAVADATASGAWGRYHGPHVCALEAELAQFHGVPLALTCASGTLAVEAALRALRVGPGDEVVMAAYDYEPTFLVIHAIGAKPVLIDVCPANWQLAPANLEAAITPLTKAVVCSHLHGGLVPMREVTEIARARGIGVVEDAAQAPGALVDGKPAGTWGDVGVLSFGGSKLLTAGRGGAVLFGTAALHQRAKAWLHRGLQQWAPLSELQAAALRPQLRKLPQATEWRAERVRELVALLPTELRALAEPTPQPPPCREGEPDIDSPLTSAAREGSGSPSLQGGGWGVGSSAFYKLGLQFSPTAFGLSRGLFVKALRAEGCAFDAGFNALHLGRSPSRFRAAGTLTNAADAHERCVTLSHPVLSSATADVRRVAEAVAKVYRYRDELTRSAAPRG